MTHISFYQVPGDYQSALALACELAVHAVSCHPDVLLHVPDHRAGARLDELLANHPAAALTTRSVAAQPRHPLSISWGDTPLQHHGLLINLCPVATADWFSRFDKLIEIVYDDHAVIEHKRARYRYYRDRGYPLGFQEQNRPPAAATA